MGYIHTEDATIYYEVEGEGFPIVFIHGLGLSHINWRPQVDYFKTRGYKTITLDVRGHGKTQTILDTNKQKPIVQQVCQDIYRVLKQLHVQHCAMVGYSTGTVIAQQFIITYPELVKGLVLSGAFPKISNLYLFGKFAGGFGLTMLNIRTPLEKGVARHNGKNEEQINAFRKEAKKVNRKEAMRLLKDSLFFDCRKQLQKVKQPILVTFGGNERHMMKYRTEYLQLTPKAEVCLFPHVNHSTMTKKTDQYNMVLHDFFNRITNKDHHYFLKPSMINPIPIPINTNLE